MERPQSNPFSLTTELAAADLVDVEVRALLCQIARTCPESALRQLRAVVLKAPTKFERAA